MWGIIPAAGHGSRIQPLAFSKELLPVGSRQEGQFERPRAVCEYLIERMILGGADKLCFVISPGKTDILEYFGSRVWGADIVYVVQPEPAGLCDAIFRAIPLMQSEEPILIGLPDTIWSPLDGYAKLPLAEFSFLLFPVDRPELFDAVVTNVDWSIERIEVKHATPSTHWVWGGVRIPARVFRELYEFWLSPGRKDEYFGALTNAWLLKGGKALGVRAGNAYVDVGTLHGYRAAMRLLERDPSLEGLPKSAQEDGER